MHVCYKGKKGGKIQLYSLLTSHEQIENAMFSCSLIYLIEFMY